MKTALIFGSSGLIGSHLLDIILQKNKYDKIKLFVRSLPEIYDSRVDIIQTNFTDIEKHKNLINGDDCFFCIGTTRKDTPNKKEYRRVEYEIPVNIAKIAKSNSVNSFIYVSSLGANSKSNGSYLKNKGQVEEELKKIGFSNLSIIQPSFLVGNRKDFRIVEVLGIPVMKFLSLFFFGGFKKYTPIKVEIVVNAMIKLASGNNSEQTYLSDRLQELGSN